MKLHELLVVSTLTAIMTTLGIKALSPEAKEFTDQVVFWAVVQDRYAVIKTEITGHDYTQIQSPITPEEIEVIASAVRASGYDQTPEIQNAATQLETRFTQP
jgi:hypothetical protein